MEPQSACYQERKRPYSRGGILLGIPSQLTVTDASDIHPASATHAQAAQTMGGAAILLYDL